MISWKHECLLHFSETLKVHLQRHNEEHILAIQPNNFSISISDNINFKYFFLMTCKKKFMKFPSRSSDFFMKSENINFKNFFLMTRKKFGNMFVKLTPHQMHFPLYIL